MRRVVYATKADDLRKARAQYDADLGELERKHDEQTSAWRAASRELDKKVQEDVLEVIGPTSLQLEVNAREGWRDNGYEVSVRPSGAQSLNWNFDVKLNEKGETVKESGSWSGLHAVTFEQIDELKESVRVIEKLNGINWPALLFQKGPDWDEYVDTELAQAYSDKKKNRPNYEQDIAAAELEDLIGTDTWVKLAGSPTESFGYRDYRYTYWAKIKKITPSQVQVELCNTPGNSWSTDYRVKKENFLNHIADPFETAQEGEQVE